MLFKGNKRKHWFRVVFVSWRVRKTKLIYSNKNWKFPRMQSTLYRWQRHIRVQTRLRALNFSDVLGTRKETKIDWKLSARTSRNNIRPRRVYRNDRPESQHFWRFNATAGYVTVGYFPDQQKSQFPETRLEATPCSSHSRNIPVVTYPIRIL